MPPARSHSLSTMSGSCDSAISLPEQCVRTPSLIVNRSFVRLVCGQTILMGCPANSVGYCTSLSDLRDRIRTASSVSVLTLKPAPWKSDALQRLRPHLADRAQQIPTLCYSIFSDLTCHQNSLIVAGSKAGPLNVYLVYPLANKISNIHNEPRINVCFAAGITFFAVRRMCNHIRFALARAAQRRPP